MFFKSYVDFLESQQLQLISGIEALYNRLVAGKAWEGELVKSSADGHLLIHTILDRLGLLESKDEALEFVSHVQTKKGSLQYAKQKNSPTSPHCPEQLVTPSPSSVEASLDDRRSSVDSISSPTSFVLPVVAGMEDSSIFQFDGVPNSASSIEIPMNDSFESNLFSWADSQQACPRLSCAISTLPWDQQQQQQQWLVNESPTVQCQTQTGAIMMQNVSWGQQQQWPSNESSSYCRRDQLDDETMQEISWEKQQQWVSSCSPSLQTRLNSSQSVLNNATTLQSAGVMSAPEHKRSTKKPKPSARKQVPKDLEKPKMKKEPLVKRSAHSVIEKRYRMSLNGKIEALRDSVPSLRPTSLISRDDGEADGKTRPSPTVPEPVVKLNKATILAKTTEYIRHLEERNKQICDESQAVRTQLDTFERLSLASAV
ncbi:hypothetical protein MMC12_002183 [Toensbergia leucococca]|nr:hypothetical protein [Toensbergia leucococca]